MGTIYETLYNRTIQFGAHPNEKSITANLNFDDSQTPAVILQIYFQDDNVILEHWIHTANQVGICVLEIFEHVHRKRFERLGVRSRIATLSEGL